MAKHRRPPGDDPSTGEEVVDSPGTAYWSVDDCRWPTVRPNLPADVVELLAPPIVVGVARVAPTSRLTPPAALATRPGPSVASVNRSTGVGPAGTRSTSANAGPAGTAPARRPAPVPGPAGLHRHAKGPAERG